MTLAYLAQATDRPDREAGTGLHGGARPMRWTGLLLRMRSWFASQAPVAAERAVRAEMAGASIPSLQDAATEHSTVIAFPSSGRTQLVQLAQELKQPFVELGLDDHAPLSLCVFGGARPCLQIDPAAYVEFRGSQVGYYAVFDDVFETRMTLETMDLDAVARVARAYIFVRLADAGYVGGAA